MRTLARLRRGLAIVQPRELRVGKEPCALCRFPLSIRLRNEEMGVRCLRCGASAVTQSLVDVLEQLDIALARISVYELSAQGPLVEYLRRHSGQLTLSEYFPDLNPGEWRGDAQCQDVQSLSHQDGQFDLCTSTEVFEHVERDDAGFREMHRILRPGGWCVFTVPLDTHSATVERTALENGVRRNVLPPEYHADRYRGAQVFCYRNYGVDILDRLRDSGFAHAEIRQPRLKLFGFARPVVCARKAT